jgi:hypothetical protein
VTPAGLFPDDYGMPYENDMTIWVLMGRRTALKLDWDQFKHYE